MTAICGLLGDAAQGLDAMSAALADYGADAATWTEGAVGLAVRTAWTKEDRATSLLHFAHDAGLVLAADARLDDRDTLCNVLGVPHPERVTISDGALILRAYLRWGRACPTHLLGDYAFAVWDARQRMLFCARDHVGVRPFYYALQGGRVVFASAVEAVLAAPGVSDALDEATVATYLTSEVLRTNTRTFFEAVRKLAPGHTLTVEAEGARKGSAPLRTRSERYWHPEQAPLAQPASDDAYAEQFLDLYAQAVGDRLHGGPVGVHLSGGLDSSSIAVLAARELRRRNRPLPPAFAWLPELGDTPPSPEHAQEYALVRAVSEQEGLQTFHCAIEPRDVLTILRSDIALPGIHAHMNEEPVQRSAATQGVRVLLSGWGGDEGVSFNGRGHWQHLLLSGRWWRLVAEYRTQTASAVSFLLARVVLPLLHPMLPRTLERLRKRRPARRWFIDPAFARRVRPQVSVPARDVGVRRTQLRMLQDGVLSLRMEGWAASGARRGIEYRYPLLDRRLLEFALGLPPEQFRRGLWTRWIMRYGLREILPREVCWDRSKGDPARVEMWTEAFAQALPTVRRLLAERPPSRAGYVDMPRLREHLDPDRFRANPYRAPLRKALQILDF